MTSLFKLACGVLVLSAAVFTAKFLHQTEEPQPPKVVAKKPTAPKLRWQAAIQPADRQSPPSLAVIDRPRTAVGDLTAPPLSKPATAARLVSSLSSGARELPESQETAVQQLGDVQFAPLSESTPAPTDPNFATIDSDPERVTLADDTRRSKPGPLPFSRTQPVGPLVPVGQADQVAGWSAERVTHYTVQFGDTLPKIAERYLGSREKYLRLYEANLDVLVSPAELLPGTVLKIPER